MVHHGPSHLPFRFDRFFLHLPGPIQIAENPKTSGPGSMLSKAPGEPVLFFFRITIGSTGFWWCLGAEEMCESLEDCEFWFWFRPPDFCPTQRIMFLHGLEDDFLGKTMCRYTFLILDGREVHCWGWKNQSVQRLVRFIMIHAFWNRHYILYFVFMYVYKKKYIICNMRVEQKIHERCFFCVGLWGYVMNSLG